MHNTIIIKNIEWEKKEKRLSFPYAHSALTCCYIISEEVERKKLLEEKRVTTHSNNFKLPLTQIPLLYLALA